MVVVDSGALLAIYDASDQHHEAVLQAAQEHPGPLVLPVAILAEADYLIRHLLGVNAELDFLQTLTDETYLLTEFTVADRVRCLELVRAYRDLDLGLADAAVMATAERLGVREILTVDQRHFRAVRPKIGPFVILPFDTGLALH